jgi:PAS domain S-box-containing protein
MAKAVLAIESGLSLEQAKIRANDEMSGSMKVLIDTVLTMYDSLSIRTMDLMREKALRKQAEAALLASEERWQFILEDTGENVWDWDIEHDDIIFSDDESSLLDVIDNHLHETGKTSTIHPSDIKRVQDALQEHLNDNTEFFTIKYRVLRKNGGWSWVLTRGKVVSRNENGEALRMVGTHSDVTERELAGLIFQYSSQAMFVTDKNNAIISSNPAFTKISGYSLEDLVGRNPGFFASGKHDDAFYQDMWEAINTNGQWSGEVWNKRKNGEIYPLSLHINTVSSPDGLVDHYITLCSDITVRKQAEEQLRKLSRAVEQSHSTIIVTDRNANIEFVNPAFTRITGYTEAEAIGQNPRILHSGHHDETFYREMWDTLTRDEDWQGEILNKRKDGSLYWEFANLSPVKDEAGQTTHYVAVKEDITARKEAQEAIIQAKEAADAANEAKSTFLSNMSHELRTPMHGILGFSEMGENKTRNEADEKLHHYFFRIHKSGRRLLTLLDDLLDLSKLEAGRMQFNLQDYDLAVVVDAAVTELEEVAHKKALHIVVESPTVDTAAYIDPERMLQVVHNLLSNAIKFTPERKGIVISFGEAELPSTKQDTDIETVPALKLTVSDEGIGIPEDDLEAIFDKFIQSSKIHIDAGGTGLGLAICQEIIEGHGGTIQAANRAQGGAVFTATLPRSAV